MHTETLTTDWHQVVDLDDPTFTMLVTQGDTVDVAMDYTEPPSNAATFPLEAGIHRCEILPDRFLWLKTAGTASATYSRKELEALPPEEPE